MFEKLVLTYDQSLLNAAKLEDVETTSNFQDVDEGTNLQTMMFERLHLLIRSESLNSAMLAGGFEGVVSELAAMGEEDRDKVDEVAEP